MIKTDLSRYDNSWYETRGSSMKRIIWYFINVLFILNPFNPSSGIKVRLLRLFGAKIGKKVVIKPRVNIKYPWNLSIGDYSWIGENVWIDNLTQVTIGSNVCISQGAMLLCGNHNYKSAAFDLMTGKIKIEDGVWICAQSVVCPRVTMHSHSVLGINSVANHDLEGYGIYLGIPAVKIRDRIIE
ncbi:WcaF family extracellular polysaccharide biosynthesis acetyltransferase [Dysgonomonas termitidis]|uniref:WcaF family extracellular polysaccharide biosynthesis acetyltransferase n=1 Tax=Dysgonomonas termitidis TaxID=1516126 RepID=A0ABV9KWM3_9BACT